MYNFFYLPLYRASKIDRIYLKLSQQTEAKPSGRYFANRRNRLFRLRTIRYLAVESLKIFTAFVLVHADRTWFRQRNNIAEGNRSRHFPWTYTRL